MLVSSSIVSSRFSGADRTETMELERRVRARAARRRAYPIDSETKRHPCTFCCYPGFALRHATTPGKSYSIRKIRGLYKA